MIKIKGLTTTIAFKLSKNYAFELVLLSKIGNYKDYISFFGLECDLSRYRCDHNPSFSFIATILNINLIELSIHNVNHVDDGLDYNDIEDFWTDTTFPKDKER